MDLLSPRSGFTVRRNPPRKAKQTPLSDALNSPTRSAAAAVTGDITRFPLEKLLERPETYPIPNLKPLKSKGENSDSLKVFLRIRPLRSRGLPDSNLAGEHARVPARGKVAKNGERKDRSCLFVNSVSSVTLRAPPSALDSKRTKTEVYDGFSYVFPPQTLQEDIYGKVMQPLVMNLMEGQSSLLVAMGPTGSGKTYTMFGSPLEPGIVPLALRQIFCNETRHENVQATRAYYLSMFEIHSERGKGEKIYDLSPENVDLPCQPSIINSPKKVKISNATDAEKIVRDGMLKRSTAPTNANSQSSRSQCVINIHCVPESHCDNHYICNSVLTIADLAGAERERKTGNQGARLLESNFINNTSMVFGLCLRSLLEHQKNPKKPIEKHFKNSLLTRYLQDYMEGKKRMTLILTVKGSQEDYVDTSFVLRQASPYMKIKFNHLQELTNAQCQKRNAEIIRTDKNKRRKIHVLETSLIDTENVVMDASSPNQISDKGSLQMAFNGKHGFEELHTELCKIKRSEEIMTNIARAFWTMLKQYKNKLKESTEEVYCLKERLGRQSSQVTEMEKELKELKQLKELRNSCSCHSNHVEDCAKNLLFNCCDALSLVPSSNRDSLGTDAFLDENQARLLPETSQITVFAQKAHTFGANISGDQRNSRSSVQQSTLPQVENGEVYTRFSLDKNANDQSYLLSEVNSHDQLLNENPENFQRVEQSPVQVGKFDVVVMASTNVASLSETEGCFSRLPGNEGTEVTVEEQPEAKVVLDQYVQQSSMSHVAETLKTEEQPEPKVVLDQYVQPSKKSHVTETLKTEEEDLALRPLNFKKPRRKLLPASAMLLKDLGEFDMDENSKEVNGKATSNANNGKSQGIISLMRILKSNLPR